MKPILATRNRMCPLCDAQKPKLWFTKDGFRYVRCAACGLVYVDEVAAENVHFEDALFANQKVASLKANPARAERMGRFTAMLRARFGERKDLKILDVGSGKGWNLLYLKNAGYTHARGIDINKQAIATARQHGLEIDEALLEERRYDAGSFDAILSDQVIEHLEAPKPLVAEIRRILAPGGIFWSSVPNVDAWHIRFFLREKHRHFAGDRHMNMFSPATYRRLLVEAGFQVEEVGAYFEEVTLGTLKAIFLSPGDFDHGAITSGKEKKAALQDQKVEPAAAAPRKNGIKRLIAPVDAMLIGLTRAMKAGAYLEASATRG